jgi:SAM-dependent methyltransferase
LKILDVGCGLGFLSYISAEFYRNAGITGIDTFEHSNLKRSRLEGAKENARTLDFSDRIIFKKDNMFRFTPAEKFDIIVSNLVFYNFGKKRFKAGSFVIMGNLFFSPKIEIAQLEKAFRNLRQIKPKNGFEQYVLLVMSRDSGQVHMD